MKYCLICARHGFAQVPVMQGSNYCSDCDMERESANIEHEEYLYNSEEYE